MWRLWTAIAGNNPVGIIVVFIIREDLEGVVVSCQTLVHNGRLSDGDWCCNGVRHLATLGGAATATLRGVQAPPSEM
jgi:hypothetical protein